MDEMINSGENVVEEPQKSSKGSNALTIILIVLCVMLAVVAYLNTYVFFLVEVSGESMMPTLQSGDVVTVNRKLQAKEGDIVIIEGKKNGSYIIKRVIATGGDVVKIKDGKVFVNGEEINEPYIIKENGTAPTGKKSEWTLEEGQIFFLGDNRINSKDSRDDQYGPCTKEQIVGVVESWSLSTIGINKFFYSLGRK
jgi:signal peptidase I